MCIFFLRMSLTKSVFQNVSECFHSLKCVSENVLHPQPQEIKILSTEAGTIRARRNLRIDV